ncbi:MAG: hypothetical protein K8I02_00615, partial [Candidatus Methylomirabilis sp.]|nr:hypothetical protein [Deltaproteobacteria bacterium]
MEEGSAVAAGFQGSVRAIFLTLLAIFAGRPALARAADPSLCPLNMPAPESLDPVFMIGSASGNSYYDDFRDQLLLCGWPEDKLRTFELRAAGCMGAV